MSGGPLYSVKMRASRAGEHISGAERIVPPRAVPRLASALAERALSHSKGTPDAINIKIETADEPLRVKALPVSLHEARTPEEGWSLARSLLEKAGVERAAEILAMFPQTAGMRGAMLVDAATLERLEPDHARGVRATCMDSDSSAAGASPLKNHYAEAAVLAAKVAAAPGIAAEICMSDDPEYTAGYVASAKTGYARITRLKERGDRSGGRIFVYSGPRDGVRAAIDFIEKRCVLVEGVPPRPGRAEPSAAAPAEVAAKALAAAERDGLLRRTRIRPENLKIFSDNDYLGLACDERVKKAAAAAAERYGAGARSARLLSGTLPPHAELERALASFKGTEDAIAWSTGYMANTGAIPAFVSKGDAVFSDELNHASIIDGCRLSGADVFVYRHNDMDDLAAKISLAGPRARALAVSDAVFSMDGDILRYPRFLEVCRAAGVATMVDEAHATGTLGATGRGICEHFGAPHPDILMGTLSKALGSEGGYVCAPRVLCDWLRNKSRSFIFSTAPAPATVAAAAAALAILRGDPGRVARLGRNAALLARLLAKEGAQTAASGETPIVPVIVGAEKRALEIARLLEEDGYLVPAIRWPTVPRGAARLRISVSSEHSEDDIVSLAKAVGSALRRASS